MAIAQERDGNFLVLRLSGSFAEGDVDLENALEQAVMQSGAETIVELSGTDDFRAMRVLTAAERRRRDQGAMHRLALVVPAGSPTADRFMMSGMSKIIPIFATIEDVRLAWETDGFPA